MGEAAGLHSLFLKELELFSCQARSVISRELAGC